MLVAMDDDMYAQHAVDVPCTYRLAIGSDGKNMVYGFVLILYVSLAYLILSLDQHDDSTALPLVRMSLGFVAYY